MRRYNNETLLRAEHLLKGSLYEPAKVIITDIIADVPVKRGDKDGFTTGLAFENSAKVFGLNQTNFSLCCWELGEGIPAKWIGRQLELAVRLVRNRKLIEPALRVWPKVPHPNIRVREQMGDEVTDEWYKRNGVAIGGLVIEEAK